MYARRDLRTLYGILRDKYEQPKYQISEKQYRSLSQSEKKRGIKYNNQKVLNYDEFFS